jgi:hypothetical protein
MSAYTITNVNAGSPQNLSSTYKSILSMNAATGATTLRRGWIMEWEIGASDVPNATDCPINWDISEQTAAGTATALTPRVQRLGGGDAAALLDLCRQLTPSRAPSPRPRRRGSFRSTSAPPTASRCAMNSTLIVPAVNLKGFALRAKSPNYASTVSWRALVKE